MRCIYIKRVSLISPLLLCSLSLSLCLAGVVMLIHSQAGGAAGNSIQFPLPTDEP